MNHLEGHSSPHIFYDTNSSQARLQQFISTIALLILVYYVLSFLDAWPSTTKRTAYELIVRAFPSHLIYLLQRLMMHFGLLSRQDQAFGRGDFGDFRAKEEALQRILGTSPIPSVIHRARSLSGYDRILPVSKDLGPPGLGNWDNSCYQNSILQGLASLPAFQHYIHRGLLLCEKTRVAAKTTHALTSLIDQLADTTAHKQTIWTPKVLKSMDSWQQQDAQEYLSRVLEAVEKEAIGYTNIITRSAALGLGCLRQDRITHTDKEEVARKISQSLVTSPIDGMLAQALTCQTCNFSEGVSLSQFNCLTVNLGLGGSRSVEDLLDEYTAPELIEGVECDNCTRLAQQKVSGQQEDGNHRGSTAISAEDESHQKKKDVKKELRVKAKQITFGRLPKDLVIHINRSIWDSYGNQVKNPSFVQFPAELKFSGKWCAPLDVGSDIAQAVYRLQCIVTHSGRHDNGHYVAYGRRDKDWYCFNDEVVMKWSEQQVLTRGNAFMLFYEAVDDIDLAAVNGADTAEDESPVPEELVSPSSSSAGSEIYEEPIMDPLKVSVPVMRTASGSIHTVDTSNPLGNAFVPAI